eukprot:TRINITY_DN4719_c0_g1_i1.p1 TRINITY_DN4719_c0_g1~~TRINITY_DN4719_c0_g1_i1.p1  ORF type:complete len:219 (-),score=50.09 TRINITY_DN4719_c0_g1_i1:157-813(-)
MAAYEFADHADLDGSWDDFDEGGDGYDDYDCHVTAFRGKGHKRGKAQSTAAAAPSTRFKYATEANIAEFKERVRTFRGLSSRGLLLQEQLYRPFIEDVVHYLLHYYRDMFRDAFVDRSAVCVRFRRDDGDARCHPDTGVISFNINQLNKHVIDDTTSKYNAEKPIMASWIRCKEDALVWLVLHEFRHLFRDGEKHTEQFFMAVASMASDNLFLFGLRC